MQLCSGSRLRYSPRRSCAERRKTTPPACRCFWSFSRPKAARAVRRPIACLNLSIRNNQSPALTDRAQRTCRLLGPPRLEGPFSSAHYTARQQDYSNRYRFDGVYTPQLVVDGRFGFVGSDERLAYSAIQKSIQGKKIPMAVSSAELKGSRVTARIKVQSADRSFRGVGGVLYVALADNRQESHVARGENAGRSLAHVAVMRVLRPLGTVNLDHPSAKEVTLPVDPESGSYGYRIVAFIQDPKSGHILGIAQQKF